MPTNSYNPDTAASMIGASPSTIRNWCKTYADQLSAAANPPLGQERRLLQSDVATLQQIKAMRDAGQRADDIRSLLQSAKVSGSDSQLTIDVAPTPAPKPQEGQGDVLLLPAVLAGMDRRFEAIERRLEARERYAWLWTFGMGVWVGLVTMGAIFFAVWIAVNGL